MIKRFIACVFLFLALIVLPGCKDKTPQKEMIRPVRAIQISDPAEFTKRWFPGQAKAIQEVDLSFRVAGPLVTLSVNVGDTVGKSQELARINPRDYKVNLQNALRQLERAKATLKRAEADYERVLRIQKQDAGAVNQTLVDSNRQKAASTRAEIRSLQAVVDSARDRRRTITIESNPIFGVALPNLRTSVLE